MEKIFITEVGKEGQQRRLVIRTLNGHTYILLGGGNIPGHWSQRSEKLLCGCQLSLYSGLNCLLLLTAQKSGKSKKVDNYGRDEWKK